MSPQVATREEWLTARKELLTKEKEVTRMRDAVSEQLRALPMVKLDKDYEFDGPDGKVRLLDLFEGRKQLIVYHLMWLDDRNEGCPSCSLMVDNMGNLSHLHAENTSLVVASRAPLAELQAFRQRLGWTVPFVSSHGSDFNYDFHVTQDESVVPVEYNYKNKAELEAAGMGWVADGPRDVHGISVFLREGDEVFHTYSSYGRGPEFGLGTYQYLDITPLGRQRYVTEFLHHDKYEAQDEHAHCH